jgi:hypothetical protein
MAEGAFAGAGDPAGGRDPHPVKRARGACI